MKGSLLAVFSILLIGRKMSSSLKTDKLRDESENTCDPVVDMLFVFDNSSNVNGTVFEAQEEFVSTLMKQHHAPKGAVHVAISVCSESNTYTTDFTENYTSVSQTYKKRSGSTGRLEDRHCLNSMNYKFKTESRDGVARIAVIFKFVWNWDNRYMEMQKEVSVRENIVTVVIVVGVNDFDSLSSLQRLATEDGTFFVVARYQDLDKLATNLAKDSCKPISLDLTSKTRLSTHTTKSPVKSYEPCIQLGERTYKKHIPGFGYTRRVCKNQQTFSINTCSCV